ncbi:MAG: XRE family transcriptional regulator [Lachnospiraceae bacterium]|nr:XRE family transcriptional regulator [Lachnospiraceae bacterium]
MIGEMIAKVRKDKGLTKTELARLTDVNIGHLTHIEKGERNPSHKTLKNICKALDIPYQQLMYTYDKEVTEEQEEYKFIDHISYNKVVAVNSINGFIDCPPSIPSSSMAIKMPDDSMESSFKKGEYIFLELNTLLNSNEIGLFSVNNKIYVRRFSNKKNRITLKADNKNYDSISIAENDEFYIIGKILSK